MCRPTPSLPSKNEVGSRGGEAEVATRAETFPQERGPRSATHPARETFPRERGSATITALATIAAALIVLIGLMLVSGVAAARGRAQSAADLSALAAARALHNLQGDPCAIAARVVWANGAILTGCATEGVDVVVSAAVGVEWMGRATGLTASASARAGPADPRLPAGLWASPPE